MSISGCTPEDESTAGLAAEETGIEANAADFIRRKSKAKSQQALSADLGSALSKSAARVSRSWQSHKNSRLDATNRGAIGLVAPLNANQEMRPASPEHGCRCSFREIRGNGSAAFDNGPLPNGLGIDEGLLLLHRIRRSFTTTGSALPWRHCSWRKAPSWVIGAQHCLA